MTSFFTPENFVNALSLGALYALIAVGYTMVYGIIKLINFAHGEIFMLGAFWALLVVGFEQATGINVFVALLPAMLLCAAVGMSVDWASYLSLRRRLPLADGLSVVLLGALGIGAIAYKLTGETTHAWHSESAHAFLQWGVDEVAYVRPMVNDGQIVFAIHRADGQRLGIAASGNLALAAIIQNDLEPVALH